MLYDCERKLFICPILGVLLQNLKQHSMEAPKVQNMTDANRRASTGSVVKKDGFRVPQQPAATRVKQRNIAPSQPAPAAGTQPKSSVVQQNTFLAQLLMTGKNNNHQYSNMKMEHLAPQI